MDKTDIDEISWSIDNRSKPTSKSKLEAAYINTLINRASHKTKLRCQTLLDVPCGEGRLHNYLRGYGYDVYGIDKNPRFIIKAKRKYKNYTNKYYTASMKSFHLNRKFDAVLCWFTSFGYQKHNENRTVINNFSRHLKKGGILILEVLSKEWYVINKQTKSYQIDEYPKFVRLITSSVNKKGKIMEVLHSSKTYKKLDKNLIFLDRFKQKITLYDKKEMKDMLSGAGLRVIYRFERLSLRSGAVPKNTVFVCVRA